MRDSRRSTMALTDEEQRQFEELTRQLTGSGSALGRRLSSLSMLRGRALVLHPAVALPLALSALPLAMWRGWYVLGLAGYLLAVVSVVDVVRRSGPRLGRRFASLTPGARFGGIVAAVIAALLFNLSPGGGAAPSPEEGVAAPEANATEPAQPGTSARRAGPTQTTPFGLPSHETETDDPQSDR
jgi:hypothetical protein